SRTRDAFCIGRSLPIAAILPPVMPTSATYESVGVTTVPLRMIRSKLITASVRKEQGTMLHCRPSLLHNQGSARKKGVAMQFGITLKPDISIERIVGLTRLAERVGFEYGWIFD